MPERAYAARYFAHFTRETFPIIAGVAERLDGPVRMADLSCGPAVLDGVVAARLGERLAELRLLDIEPRFLELAKRHLVDLPVAPVTHAADLNDPAGFPTLIGLNLIVSTNAIFHATRDALPKLYGWCHGALGPGGVLINHQTFGLPADFDAEFKRLCPHLHAHENLDELDREVMRRSLIDTKAAATGGAGGGYAGVGLTVDHHLDVLRNLGFVASEIWRTGTSAMLLALKPA